MRLIMLARLDLILLFLLIYDMTVKPDFGDTASILWGLAGAAVAAGLVYWRYKVALSQPPPGRRPAPAELSLGLELHQERPAGDAVARGHVHGLHGACEGRVDGDLHLHRLEDHERLSSSDLGAGLDLDANHGPRHGSGHGALPVHRRRAAATRRRRPAAVRPVAPAGSAATASERPPAAGAAEAPTTADAR